MNTELFILALAITALAVADIPRSALRLPRFSVSHRQRVRSADQIRKVCEQTRDCNLDITFFSSTAAMFTCETHGLIRLVIGQEDVSELEDRCEHLPNAHWHEDK